MKRKLLALTLVFFSSLCALADEYPKINVSGYKKWEYREAKVSPQSNYFSGLTQLGGFSPTATGGPWQERLQLNILGQLTEKLAVSYDIEQQPESPDRYDVKVNYDNKHELAFGDLTATFSGNEFASATKYVNGVMISSHDNGYSMTAVPSAKLKSQVQNLTSQKGTNTKGPYSLGHGTIVEGSERIELNTVLLQRGKDYIIDYFEGKITFNRILTAADEFTYSYEYTNILDMFFPSLSKKDFFGFQGKLTFDPSSWGKPAPVPQQVIETSRESFPTAIKLPFIGKIITAETLATKEAKIIAQKTGTIEAKISAEATATPEIKAENLSQIQEDILADESVGKYRLKSSQIIPFSEKVLFKGVVLKKNEDYNIKYDEGLVTLLLPVLPTTLEPMEITYSYPKTVDEQDAINGSGSRGPYNLDFGKIISFTERIYINDRLVVRDYDYGIDYDAGKIIFNYNVSNTSVIKANYKRVVMELPPPPPPPKFPKEITLGMTYLRESAKKGSSTATGDNVEARSGSSIVSNNNTIYLARFPILSTAEGGSLSVKIGNQELVAGVDYAIPTTESDPQTGLTRVVPDAKLAYINYRYDLTDGYNTGTIKILTSVEATAEVSVLYSYKKSISGRFTGTGAGSRGPYYIKNYRNIVPGSEKLDVWTTGASLITTYVRNSSFEADAGDLGYAISYDKDNPFIMFNKELSNIQNFSIYFQYVVPSAPAGGDVAQDVTGFDGSFKIGDVIQFDGSYARSSNDRVISSVGSSESFKNFTVPTNKLPKLSKTPVIENSDQVYVNSNLMNRDIDYFVDYSGGQITFYYITLTTNDVVSVDYKYQSLDQGVQQQTAALIGNAYKYGLRSSLGGVLGLSYSRKQIGFDFSPLGGTAIGVGTDYRDFGLTFTPAFHGMSFSHSYKETQNPLSNSRSAFTKSYDRGYSFGINPWSLMSIGLSVRNLETKGDPSSAGGSPSADNVQNSYSLSLTPATLQRGALSFSQQYSASRTLADDNLSLAGSKSEYLQLNNSLSLTDRVKLGYDYQYSEPKSYTKGTSEVINSLSSSRDMSYDMSLDLTFPRIQKWTAYAKIINHIAKTYIPTPESVSETRNTTYHTEFNPIPMLNTSADYSRQETPSVTVLGKNPKTERTATSIRLSPLSYLTSSWGYSEDLTVHETARESKGRSNTYSADWATLSLEKLKINSRYNYYYRTATTPSGTIDASSDQNSFTQDYGVTFTPTSFLSITPGFSQEDYRSSTSTATTELITRNQTARCHVDLTPNERLKVAADYSNKITASLSDNVNRPKTAITIKTNLAIFNWGELVYTIDQEMNRGEVQAGGTLPSIDYRKSSNTYNLNINVPQDNPILSSIVITATAKYVRFENFLEDRALENLDAQLWTLEGTLNF